ncbi:hypothetical protein L486_07354 [Kwoniella mangroviensis CBS 10435]|uniref:Uncharacterized protein n=1 Tax=Kwoniella mangroviensis CBS 10435 TaxID=1331196 RepID=A0A1B9IIJ9_9TREE|nr:hypothetical protein L486_07354 [Kwoniella mangroviensis CBS 10435]
MYPQFTSFHPYGYPSRLSQATLVESTTPIPPKPLSPFTNSGQTPFLHWRNYDIIGLDRNTALGFFNMLDRDIHVALTKRRSILSPTRPYQTVELRMDIIPYNETEADLYDYETAFFLRCGKAKEWSTCECKVLHEVVKRCLPRGCTTSSAPPKLGADINTDSLILIRSNSPLSGSQVDALFDAVQGAARDVGGSMCPVRDQQGQAVDPTKSKWSRFRKKMHI